MTISVIIPTCNRLVLLSKCLDLLAPGVQTVNKRDYEVIVTDDSTDSFTNIQIKEKYVWATWIKGPQKGPAANRNNGARNAKGDWLIFIDDDCLPDKNILENYQVAILKHTDVQAFEGAIHPDNWNLMKKEMAECPVNMEGNSFWSANIAVKKALFYAVDGFDDRFLIAAQEDQDLFERLKTHTKIPFLANCIVVHPVRFITVQKKIRGLKAASINYIYYLKKHNVMDVRTYFLKSISYYTKLAIKDVIHFRFRLLFLNTVHSLYSLYLLFTYRNN